MKKLFTRLISIGALSVLANQVLAAPIDATLHKDPNCGCCVEYAHYLEDNGFNVTQINHANMTPVKQRLGTAQAASCHTVEIEGYVVEGHVPVAAINKMLTEQPEIKGIALPGMPYNSPGMGPEKKGSLQVLQLDAQGKPTGIYITL
ncbi:CopG family transcriptional regulator [Pseudomonas sp. C27(2019)]|uniref:DUF411 domain-containing protein n=1 Tax=Pseudomonas sp. C27(2019) TaxID=2604941 RepID=UPI001245F163|nr:DUF411 domain-containing protein [Pseudomonas sp. C27(2019)]QEY59962.1 CopG family transcriptional regulator [Pseudomonas sp. C27(2019)]